MAVISTGFTGAVIIIMFIGVTGIDIKVVLLLCLYYQSRYIWKKVAAFCSKMYIVGEHKKG